MVMSVVAGLLAGSVALLVVNADWSSEVLAKLELDVDEGRKLSGAEVAAWMHQHALQIFLGFAGLAAIIGVPSWLSSAHKLADAAMYRLRCSTRAAASASGTAAPGHLV